MAFAYLMHGIALSLPFLCPDLGAPECGLDGGRMVEAGPVPHRLEPATMCLGQHDLSPAAMLFRGGRHSARFLVENGARITFSKNPRCDEALFVHHLLCPVMAGALWQRGSCVLHASSLLSPHGAVLVTGQSGAGKSTTVARLVMDGWPLQTDDISAIGAGASGVLEIQPGARAIQLDEQASASLGFDTRGLERHAWQRQKMSVPVPIADPRRGAPVVRIIFLQHAETFSVRTARGRDKLDLLLQAIYGPVLPDVIAGIDALLGRFLRDIEMVVIGRPPEQWTLEEVVEVIRDG